MYFWQFAEPSTFSFYIWSVSDLFSKLFRYDFDIGTSDCQKINVLVLVKDWQLQNQF